MNTSCFACKGGECIALDPAPCFYTKPRPCLFFKTRRQQEAALQIVNDAIAAKPAEQQQYIAGKYYGGAMPWKEGR